MFLAHEQCCHQYGDRSGRGRPDAVPGFHLPVRAKPAGLFSGVAAELGGLYASLRSGCVGGIPAAFGSDLISGFSAFGGDGGRYFYLDSPDAREIPIAGV